MRRIATIGRKIGSCCLFGAPAGVMVWVFLHILLSYLRGDGSFHPYNYALVRVYGSDLNAVTAQCIGAMFIGMLWASASLIYRETDWSLTKQTVVNCLVCTVPALAIAYAMHWMPRSLDGLEQYVRLFGIFYAISWIVQYGKIRRRLMQINAKLKTLQGE